MHHILRIVRIALNYKYRLILAYMCTAGAMVAYVYLPRYFGDAIDAIAEPIKLNQQISESDVLLAAASNAVIIGFQVQVSSNAKLQAQQEGVDIRTYSIIYQAVEEVTLALEGLLEPEKVEEVLGKAVVQEVFKIPKIGFIAGSKVVEGIIKRNARARIIREEEEISEGEIVSLKHIKDDAKEMKEGFECGIGVDEFSKFKEGDTIVCYEIKSIKRTLELN